MSENISGIVDVTSTTNSSTIFVVSPRSNFPKWIIVLILIVLLIAGISAAGALFFVDSDQEAKNTQSFARQTTQCTEPWSKSNQEIVNFLNENNVDVYLIKRKSDHSIGSVCEACDCPGGEIIIIDIDSNNEQIILDLGFKPLSGLDSLLNF